MICRPYYLCFPWLQALYFDTFDSGHIQAIQERNKRQQDQDVGSRGVYMLGEGVCFADEAGMASSWLGECRFRRKCAQSRLSVNVTVDAILC